jgi:hypothetical protein
MDCGFSGSCGGFWAASSLQIAPFISTRMMSVEWHF